METPSDFGIIGMAVMGQNLALNVESRGFAVSVFNRTAATAEAFVAAHPGLRLVGCPTLPDFVRSLARPRRLMLMVKAGPPVDALLDALIPLLQADDIVVDGGNSLYTDTERRGDRLAAAGLRFVGCGVSGGEEGARKGPSLMPGGPASAWAELRPILEAIAASVDGQPCVVHIGPGGAGHYVKMIHNGIEYGDMQLICEAYSLLRAAGFEPAEMAAVFDRWNAGELQSYLIEITARILEQRDAETGQPLVELILDQAGQKGTGQWTQLSAADNAVVIGTIGAAVEARVMSAHKPLRLAASRLLQGPPATLAVDKAALVAAVHDALYASKAVSYAQGLELMRTVGRGKRWGLDIGAIAGIWRGGCIIRARLLGPIGEAFRGDPDLPNLLLAPFFVDLLARGQQRWREVVALAVGNGLPVPAFSASLAFYDSLRSARLPANLLQAQRDFFGAHGYQRVDKPAGELFHGDWPEVIG